MSFLLLLSRIGAISNIVPATIGLIRYKSLNTTLRLLLIYCIIISVKEIICVSLSINGYRNLEIYNISNIVDIIPLYLIYYFEFQTTRLKKFVLTLIVILTLFSTYNIVWLQGLDKFNTYSMFIDHFFKITITLVYFYNLLKKAENLDLIKTPLFWISSGLLIYSVGTFLVFSLYEIHVDFPKDTRRAIWAVNSILYIFLNIIFSIAFLCKPKTKTY